MKIAGYFLSDSRKPCHKLWFIYLSDIISHHLFAGPLVIGSCISVLMILFWYSVGVFDFLHKLPFSQKDLHYAGNSLFFSILSGYATGGCALAADRAVSYMDSLRDKLHPRFSAVESDHNAWKEAIKCLPINVWFLLTIIGIGFGLVLCFTYDSAIEPRFKDMLLEPQKYTTAEMALPLHTILYWGLMFPVFFWMIRVSLFFRELGKDVKIDLLNLGTLKPFGHIATGNAILMIVPISLLPLLWLGQNIHLHEILIVVLGLCPAIAVIIYLPIYHLGQRVKDAKIVELKLIHTAIAGNRAVLTTSSIAAHSDHFGLHELIAWRREIKLLSSFPINLETFKGIAVHAGSGLMLSGGTWLFTILRVTIGH